MPDNNFALQNIKSEKLDEELSLRPYNILSYPADFTLELLVQKWNRGEIRKEGFQRKYVWPQIRASKLIESFLLGLPVPPVYLYEERETGRKLIVDGHQRLRTIVYFFSGVFGDEEEMAPKDIVPFHLLGLHQDSPFANATIQSLGEEDPEVLNRLKDAVLRSIIMKQVEPDDDTSIFEIFSRFNTGGVPLLPQEIRNCISFGAFNELLKTLNRNQSWRQILGTQAEDKRMRDVELILRFLALSSPHEPYEKPMKDFLNRFMKDHKDLIDQEAFTAMFEATAMSVLRCLGPKPFHIKRGLNAAVFDSVFTAFGNNLEASQVCDPDTIRGRYNRLLTDPDYVRWTSSATTDNDVVRQRLVKASHILFG